MIFRGNFTQSAGIKSNESRRHLYVCETRFSSMSKRSQFPPLRRELTPTCKRNQLQFWNFLALAAFEKDAEYRED